MSTGNELVKLRQVNSLYKDLRGRSAPIITEPVSGNPIIFNDGADGLPLLDCKLTLLPRQSGSGDASPDNIRPLISWENVGMWTGGKNLLNLNRTEGTPNPTDLSSYTSPRVMDTEHYYRGIQSANYYYKTYAEATVGNEEVRVTATNNNGYGVGLPVHVKGGTHYTLSAVAENALVSFGFYDKSWEYLPGANQQEQYHFPMTITTPNDAYYMVIVFRSQSNVEYVYSNIQLEVGDTATTYIPYIPVTPHPVDLSSITPPVYGCEINPITGEVWGIVDVPISVSSIDFYMVSDGVFASTTGAVNYDGSRREQITCSAYKTVAFTYWNQLGNNQVMGIDNGRTIRIRDDRFSSYDDFKAFLTEEDVKIVLPLSTPVLLATLSPQEIETLLGMNTIWSDANGIDVEYRADTELFINQNGVKDVQVNGTSVTADGVANIPQAANGGVYGVTTPGAGLTVLNGKLITNPAGVPTIKAGTSSNLPITPMYVDASAFYGLARAAGVNMNNSSNAVGTYTDAAKQGIQKMLGLDGLVGPYEADITADQAYAIGETFVMDGKRYKATAAITQGGVITPGTNCELDPLDGRYVRNDKKAGSSASDLGLVFAHGNNGVGVSEYGGLYISRADSGHIKAGTSTLKPIVPEKQHESVFYGLSKLAGVDLASSDTPVGTYTAEAKAAILAMLGAVGETDYASTNAYGLVKIGDGLGINSNNGKLQTNSAGSSTVKQGRAGYAPIVPGHQHEAAFYGLAKAAGADMEYLTGDTVGVYPQAQKDAIQSMLGIEADIPLVETVSGSTPSITGMPNVRYICGTCSTLTITPPSAGSIVVRFDSGSSPTILTVPSTVKFPAWFDYTALEANTTYEIVITDGVYGAVMSWVT